MLKEFKTGVQYTIDENRNKQGEFKEYYDNGNLKIRAMMRDNEAHGEYIEYGLDGKLVSDGWYMNGRVLFDSKEKMTAADHLMISKNNLPCLPLPEYSEGIYRNEIGDVIKHCMLKDGKIHGECKVWDSTGLIHHSFYVDGAEVDKIVNMSADDKEFLCKKFNAKMLPVYKEETPSADEQFEKLEAHVKSAVRFIGKHIVSKI